MGDWQPLIGGMVPMHGTRCTWYTSAPKWIWLPIGKRHNHVISNCFNISDILNIYLIWIPSCKVFQILWCITNTKTLVTIFTLLVIVTIFNVCYWLQPLTNFLSKNVNAEGQLLCSGQLWHTSSINKLLMEFISCVN